MTDKNPFQEVTLQDGTKAYVLTQEQLTILGTIVDNHIWWNGAWKRIAKWSKHVAYAAGLMISLALWWPAIIPLIEWWLRLVPGSRVQ